MDHLMVWTYGAYLALSLALTVFVARTLYKNGRVFLLDAFNGNAALTDSVNHLLVVGFYLINIGYVSLALKAGAAATTLQTAVEYLSWKVGIVAVVLGAMHFVNVLVFSSMRKRAVARAEREARWREVPEVRPVR
jgi:hypothetical protein